MFKTPQALLLLVAALFSVAAQAQTETDVSDPPTRVARLSYLHGDVSFVPAGENEWVEADLNRPLVSGDKLWTDRDSRAVLEIGPAALRLDEDTSFDFLNLDDNNAQIELTQGTLNLRVRRLYDGQSYEVDTPTLAFVVTRVGEFRIDVAPDGDSTIVTVRSGGGDVFGEQDARMHVEEGQSVMFRDPQLRDYSINGLPNPDAFDDFCYQRDRHWDDSPSRRFVSEEVIGYQDLDDYGDWASVPDYGYVWYPSSVAVGWSPYHFGHWAWVGVYGWTWIDDAPWGFAPFHYGRWVHIRGRWGWCPGPRDGRPVYAPALVAFVGGFNLSISRRPIGWFPLGRGDVYFPAYRVSHNYFARINVRNAGIKRSLIDNYYGPYSHGRLDYARVSYANRHIAGAVTAVPAEAFVNARSVSRAAIAVRADTFARAQVHGFARVAPTRASLARSSTARARPTAAVFKRHIVAATRPPAPVASFAQHRANLDKNPGQPLNFGQLRRSGAGTRSAGHARPIPTRANVRVVTEHGMPVHRGVPAAHAATGSAAQRQAPARATSRSISGAGTRTAPATAPAPRRLESSRFAHPAPSSRVAPAPYSSVRSATAQPHPAVRSEPSRPQYRSAPHQAVPRVQPQNSYRQQTPPQPAYERHSTPRPTYPHEQRQNNYRAAPRPEPVQRSAPHFERAAPQRTAPPPRSREPEHSHKSSHPDDDKHGHH